MVRVHRDEFLTKYLKLLQQVGKTKTGSVELTFTRHSLDGEARLPPTAVSPYLQTIRAAAASSAEMKDDVALPALDKAAVPRDAKGRRDKSVETGPAGCLVRARCGDTKFSTAVPWSDALQFNGEFGTIFRAHTDGLVGVGPSGVNLDRRLLKRKEMSRKGDASTSASSSSSSSSSSVKGGVVTEPRKPKRVRKLERAAAMAAAGIKPNQRPASAKPKASTKGKSSASSSSTSTSTAPGKSPSTPGKAAAAAAAGTPGKGKHGKR